MTPGRNPSIKASAPSIRRRMPSRSSGFLRSAATRGRPRPVMGSGTGTGAPGRSIRTMSAPMSASIIAAKGAGPRPANSTMRKSSSAPMLVDHVQAGADVGGAVDVDQLAGHQPPRIARQEGNQFGYFLRRRGAAGGGCMDQILGAIAGDGTLQPGGLDHARADAVDPHAVPRPFQRECSRHPQHTSARGDRMGEALGAALDTGKREVRDAAAAVTEIGVGGHCGGEDRGEVEVDHRIPALAADLGGARVELAAGIVDQKIDAMLATYAV